MKERLFELLRFALWGGKPDEACDANEFQDILMLAEKQTVFGLVFDVLQETKIEGLVDKKPVYEAVGATGNIKQQNRSMNKEVAWFADAMRKSGIKYLVVKGQTVAKLYPKPEVRQSGDIDFLVSQNERIKEIFPRLEMPEKMPEKEYEFNCHGVTYELHSRLIDFGCKKHKEVWQQMENQELAHPFEVEVEGVKVRTLSPTMNAAYLFVHLFFHLIREGVSLRQFCDWAVFLHHYRDAIDRQQLEAFMRCIDLLDGFNAFGSIVVDELGLPEEEFPLMITDKDRRWKKKILDDILRGGNFGRQNHSSKTALGYKFETLRLAVRNSFRYHKLAPSEMRTMIPKMVKINIRLLFS